VVISHFASYRSVYYSDLHRTWCAVRFLIDARVEKCGTTYRRLFRKRKQEKKKYSEIANVCGYRKRIARYLVDPASFGTLNLELKPCKLLSVVPQGKAFSVYGSVYR
jgi:hypothetical protein